NIRVEIGGVAEINFRLLIAGARESVTVSAEPRAVETQPRGLSAIVDERAIMNLPLNGRRFTDLCLLTPGATQDPRGQNSTSTAVYCLAAFADFIPAIWSMAATTTTPSSPRPADAIARLINFRTR